MAEIWLWILVALYLLRIDCVGNVKGFFVENKMQALW